MVCADPHGTPQSLAFQDKWREFFANPLQLSGVTLIGVLNFLEFLFVGVVPWVHTDFLHMVSRDLCCVWGEVDVSHHGHITMSSGLQSSLDQPQRLCLALGRGRDANEFTTGVNHAQSLRHRTFDVHGIDRGHRLQPNRCIPAEGQSADVNLTGRPADVVEWV